MKIKRIDWTSKEDGQAEILLIDGEFEILCLADPFDLTKFNKGEFEICCFNSTNLYIAENKSYKVDKLKDFFSYRITGKLVDKKENIIMLGKSKFYLDYQIIPGDFLEGDFIIFDCSRIDLYTF